MSILVINCGSSSAKYQLFDMASEKVLAKGLVERIGSGRSNMKHQVNGDVIKKDVACNDHYVAISLIVDALTDPVYGVIKSKDEIDGIGHRVVHGGEEFSESTLIDKQVIKSVEKYCELAPLHNPPSLLGIRACSKILKDVLQVAVFDTSFHQTMPMQAFLYGLPYKYYKHFGIRKYGFHGTSHRFVSEAAAKVLKKPLSSLRLITCHLGNGCSMTAVDKGKSVDTSMGFTPLEGLLMGTRSGDIDPAVVFYIMEKEKIGPDRISDILNKESGLLGLSGVSNDMRDLLSAAKEKGEPGLRARAALDLFTYRIKKYIGAYQAAMGELDAVIFTAGIGENNPWLVKKISKDLAKVVSKKVKFLVIPTNEELLIARDAYNIITQNSKVKSQN